MLYSKVYKSQAVVIEQALKTASLMLDGQKIRGYSLEMICADVVAGTTSGEAHAELFTTPERRHLEFLSVPERLQLIESLKRTA